jgi:hypothetical protein
MFNKGQILRAITTELRIECCGRFAYYSLPVYYKHEQVNTLELKILHSEKLESQNIFYSIQAFPHVYAFHDRTDTEQLK